MSSLSRPSFRRAFRALPCAVLAFGLATPLFAQVADRWTSTADRYDGRAVESQLEIWRGQFSRLHGTLAQQWFDLHEELAQTPHDLVQRPAAPSVPYVRYGVEAAHLLHFQAVAGRGTLGVLHGSLRHPLGLNWLPHSMFAQGGGLYGQWGFARLLGAISSHAQRHID